MRTSAFRLCFDPLPAKPVVLVSLLHHVIDYQYIPLLHSTLPRGDLFGNIVER